MVVVLVGVQGSMDSPINSQIGPFSTILQFKDVKKNTAKMHMVTVMLK